MKLHHEHAHVICPASTVNLSHLRLVKLIHIKQYTYYLQYTFYLQYIYYLQYTYYLTKIKMRVLLLLVCFQNALPNICVECLIIFQVF